VGAVVPLPVTDPVITTGELGVMLPVMVAVVVDDFSPLESRFSMLIELTR